MLNGEGSWALWLHFITLTAQRSTLVAPLKYLLPLLLGVHVCAAATFLRVEECRAALLYDACWLYAHALNEVMTNGGTPDDAHAIIHAIKQVPPNPTFLSNPCSHFAI